MRVAAAGVLLMAALAGGRPAHLIAQSREHALYVSVLDQADNPVADLGPADFVVREDKVEREVLRVEPATDPMQIALLVDNSDAAEPYIRDYREAFTGFVAAVTGNPTQRNQAAIITVGERPTINTDYTSSQAPLVKGAQRIFPTLGSGSYLLNGIIETSDAITKRHETRPVIVAVGTDGLELSGRTYNLVLSHLANSGATLDVVIVGRPIVSPINLANALDFGTKQSGGRYTNILSSSALPVQMKRVAAELTHQYRLTYARPESLLPPEQITVSTSRRGLTARGTPVKSDAEQERR